MTETRNTFGVDVTELQEQFPHLVFGSTGILTSAQVDEYIRRAAARVCATLIRSGIDPADVTNIDYPNGYELAREAVILLVRPEIQRLANPESRLVSEDRRAARDLLAELSSSPHLWGQIAADKSAVPSVATSTSTVEERFPARADRIRKLTGKLNW
jgi:hypothetical protein